MANQNATPRRASSPLRVTAASFVGTTLEFYDFFIYGTMAALVFKQLFFPGYSTLAGTLASFATFAVGFVARPLGSVFFGYMGDWFGRRGTLVVSLTMMGGSTVAIGLLPSYATAGLAAPVLLVVLLQ
ncbi:MULTISPECIES: MFS transporter [Paraburkholderia]|uniref:MFS transporter n=1 Tax=Paraburkholderia TaxID=1822464 RepID=UPI00035EE71F|nr:MULTISPECIES: MFS transporter [Paraburkholderia]MDH6147509.1 MFS family permease [Paraburkholderia sp. WSM4179]